MGWTNPALQRQPTETQLLAGERPRTQWQRISHRLGPTIQLWLWCHQSQVRCRRLGEINKTLKRFFAKATEMHITNRRRRSRRPRLHCPPSPTVRKSYCPSPHDRSPIKKTENQRNDPNPPYPAAKGGKSQTSSKIFCRAARPARRRKREGATPKCRASASVMAQLARPSTGGSVTATTKWLGSTASKRATRAFALAVTKIFIADKPTGVSIVPNSHLFPKQSEVMTSHAPRAWWLETAPYAPRKPHALASTPATPKEKTLLAFLIWRG